MVKALSARSSQRPQSAPMTYVGTVLSVKDNSCVIDISGVNHEAKIATHIPILVSGQQIIALNAGHGDWLVVAAWPIAGAEPAYRFDAHTGTLHVQAPRLQLAAIGMLELRCGNALVKLSMDGKVNIEGSEVLSSAVGSNRIEGASIDLN